MTTRALITGVQFATKREAQTFARQQGYTVLHDRGESGDGGYGSREYWTYAGCPQNAFGWPMDTLWLSKVGRVWIADQHLIPSEPVA